MRGDGEGGRKREGRGVKVWTVKGLVCFWDNVLLELFCASF